MKIKSFIYFFIICFSFLSFNAFSGVVLSGTRLIFNGNKNETSLTVTNPDKKSYLIQSWITTNDKEEKKASEFVVTPPLFRIDEKTANTIRVVLIKDVLPQDRESLFWLNVKAIPSSDPNATNLLLLSINSRIKLIYRPKNLMGENASEAYKKLSFKVDSKKQELIAYNPTPYYVNLSSLTYNKHDIGAPGMVAPFSETKWKTTNTNGGNVTWRAINDYGGITTAQNMKTQ